ncbi:MAG TPA: hypothetical protein DEA08_13530 [Planctomycetes bacterium]|nr:hypothetical protein [Planctomycetota bacterium]
MRRALTLALPLLLALAPLAAGQSQLKVKGSKKTFPSEVTHKHEKKQIPLRCTGVALREKVWFNVYVIASYVHKDATPKDAAALAKADVWKVLHLQLERNVDGDDMSEAFVEAIRANYPKESQFKAEIDRMNKLFADQECKENQSIRFVWQPKLGVTVLLPGCKPLVIKSLGFAQAIWEIYLGKKNVGKDIKSGLVKRLEK